MQHEYWGEDVTAVGSLDAVESSVKVQTILDDGELHETDPEKVPEPVQAIR